MVYLYKPNDMFYDVESLSNIFTVAWWIPHDNTVILSYLEDNELLNKEEDENKVRQYIYDKYPELWHREIHILFENIAYAGYIRELSPHNDNRPVLGMQSFAKRFGLVNEYTHWNAPVDKRDTESNGISYPPAYYPVKDTDPDYDPTQHGYRFGYNSTNYDMTILAQMLTVIPDAYFGPNLIKQRIMLDNERPLTAAYMRDYNDELFTSEWKGQMSKRLSYDPHDRSNRFGNYKAPGWIVYKGWKLTGRYIDVSRLNEKMQKVGLKRLMGLLGMQILESSKLQHNSRVESLEDIAELLAYNISDVINLQTLFEHKVYQNAFEIRGNLLATYPQCVYGQKEYAPEPGREPQVDAGNYINVRKDRLTRDSTSAKFVELALAPYKPITDIPVVSFLYPSAIQAKKLGVPQTDVLEDTKAFFEQHVTSDPTKQAHIDFMEIYNFYSSIRGHNFNNSKAYVEHYGENATYQSSDYIKTLMSTYNTNLFYHRKNKDGRVYRSSCLANFSIGGIHGAEINMDTYQKDVAEYEKEQAVQAYVESLYRSALEAINGPSTILLPAHLELTDRLKSKQMKKDGSLKIKEFIKSSASKTQAEWKTHQPVQLFKKNESGNWTIQDKYTYTSSGPSHHEDFESYYPLLLSRLSAFVNPSYHGYDANGDPADPYNDMYVERAIKKKESKDMSLSQAMRDEADEEQDLRKLLINAASGAGDAKFDNNIRANNAIISMRIIGQLFAWRIGQAQTLAGARVPSTNTDGLYTMDISAELNDQILKDVAKDMYVKIEPERLDRFVSKDSNNRLEVRNGRIISAKGGTLNSWEGPKPTQNLNHPAITDYVLAKYLSNMRFDNPANEPFDREYAKHAYHQFIDEHIQNGTANEALRFFQWIVASSSTTHRYICMRLTKKSTGETMMQNLQHYNRVFLIKNRPENDILQELRLATRVLVNPVTWEKRQKAYKAGSLLYREMWNHDANAVDILLRNGLDIQKENEDNTSSHYRAEAKINKVAGMPDDHHVAIYNYSLLTLSNEQAAGMLMELDLDAYMTMLEKTFESWSNL